MSFIQSMQQRYTTKMYNPTKKIDEQKIDELKEILRLCPSSINSQPWNFLFINSEKTKIELAKVSRHNKEKVMNCDTLVVFKRINNIQLFEKQILETLPEGAISYYNTYIKPKSEEEIKAWFGRQVYLALGVFLSACAEMNIDSTPMEGVEFKEYDKILGLKDYCSIVAVAIGYRDENDFNQIDKKPKFRKPINRVIEII